MMVTASKLEVGNVIRKTAPYKWWNDFQAVTSIKRDGRQLVITRTDGKKELVSPQAKFELQD